MNTVLFKEDDFKITDEQAKLLAEIDTIRDNVIVRVIKSDTKSAGGIILADKDVEKSTLGVVLKPNHTSYHRNGEPTNPKLRSGDIVRLQRGNVGTTMPEATDGEEWITVPEDCIYYFRRLKVESNGK